MRISALYADNCVIHTVTFEKEDFPHEDVLSIPPYVYVPPSYSGDSYNPYLAAAFNNALAEGRTSMLMLDNAIVKAKYAAPSLSELVSARFHLDPSVLAVLGWSDIYAIIRKNNLKMTDIDLYHYMIADYWNPKPLPFNETAGSKFHDIYSQHYYAFLQERDNSQGLPAWDELYLYRCVIKLFAKYFSSSGLLLNARLSGVLWKVSTHLTSEDLVNLDEILASKIEEDPKFRLPTGSMEVLLKMYAEDTVSTLEVLKTAPSSWIPRLTQA